MKNIINFNIFYYYKKIFIILLSTISSASFLIAVTSVEIAETENHFLTPFLGSKDTY